MIRHHDFICISWPLDIPKHQRDYILTFGPVEPRDSLHFLFLTLCKFTFLCTDLFRRFRRSVTLLSRSTCLLDSQVEATDESQSPILLFSSITWEGPLEPLRLLSILSASTLVVLSSRTSTSYQFVIYGQSDRGLPEHGNLTPKSQKLVQYRRSNIH